MITMSNIMAVSREDQTEASRIKLLKQEVTLSDVLDDLTTFKEVTKQQYMVYDHLPGARGTVTLKGRGVCKWELEHGYAAQINDEHGVFTYLLAPSLAVVPSSTAANAPAPWGAAGPRGAEETRPKPDDVSQFVADPALSTHPDEFKEFKVTQKAFEAILKEYYQVEEDHWMHGYSHVAFGDRTGHVTLKDGRTLKWMVKPGGLAWLEFPSGKKMFLAASK